MYRKYKGTFQKGNKGEGPIKMRPRRPPMPYSSHNSWNFENENLRVIRHSYGPSRHRKPFYFRDHPELEPTVVEKPPEPPKEFAKRLKIKDLDLMIKENAKNHRTEEYECTDDKDEDDKSKEAEPVVRRGFNMTIRIEFDRPYEKDKNDLQINLEYGDNPMIRMGTRAQMKVNEGEKIAFKPCEWGANLIKIEGSWITVEIHIAADCIIGEWELNIHSFEDGENKDGKKVLLQYEYKHKVDVNIIFNPFCKDDTTYCANMPGYAEEYVLNDEGLVYQGKEGRVSPWDWNFAQFEYGILDTVFELMRKTFKQGHFRNFNDPVRVSRALTYAICECCLVGNWSGDYKDGKAPWTWTGSKKILQEYRRTKKPVKYGQCWVFSGLLNTVCRAIGIPCRSVTNYNSAHDTDKSCTIDTFYKEDEEGVPEKDDYLTNDSVWNFHVWNEIYIKRPDLDAKTNVYDGWQAVDSTPQELSDGLYCCGPAPLTAIRLGQCNIGYDTGFVFSEVNADRFQLLKKPDGDHEVISKTSNTIGWNTVTKALGSDDWESLTGLYKPVEGSAQERETVQNAYLTAGMKLGGELYKDIKPNEVQYTIVYPHEMLIGRDLPIKVKVTNNGSQQREIDKLILTIYNKTYSGDVLDEITKQKFITKANPGTGMIDSGQVREFDFVLKSEVYMDKLVEKANILIKVGSTVKATKEHKVQKVSEEKDFVFDKPRLTVQAPEEAYKGKSVEVTLSFKNHLKKPLTNITLDEDSAAFNIDKTKPIQMPTTVPPGGTFKAVVYMKPLRWRYRVRMNFSVNCTEIYEIDGSAYVEMKPPTINI